MGLAEVRTSSTRIHYIEDHQSLAWLIIATS
jgi:hypothetical protein